MDKKRDQKRIEELEKTNRDASEAMEKLRKLEEDIRNYLEEYK